MTKIVNEESEETAISDINAPEDKVLSELGQDCLQRLLAIWFDFDLRLSKVPVVKRIEQERLSLDDYRHLLLNMRQQVIEGSRWISRCASSFDRDYSDVRSKVIKHAKDEHQDYVMLEQDYVNAGGNRSDIQQARKNIGSEALHGFLMYRASQPNPVDLIGAMWIIEGLGNKMASGWSQLIDKMGTELLIPQKISTFMSYHAQNDEAHLNELYELIDRVATDEASVTDICRTAEVVGRLYCMQLEEVDRTR